MTPRLRLPEFRNEWQFRPLGDLVSITTGRKDVNEGNPRGKYPFFTCAKDHTYSDTYSFSGKAILIAGNGEVGQCTFYEGDFEAYQRTYVLQDFKADPRYIFLILDGRFRPFAQSQRQTGAMPYIRLGTLQNYKIAMPEEEEQKKLADFLTAVDEKIAAIKKKKEQLVQYKKGAVQAIFSQRIRFRDPSGNPYPDWGEMKLGELEDRGEIKLGRGDVISKKDIEGNPGPFPIYSSSTIENGLFGHYGKYMFDEELVSWSIDGGGHFFHRPKGKFSVTNVSGWIRFIGGQVNSYFLGSQLRFLHTRKAFDYQSKAHPSVIRSAYRIKLPAIEEQRKIADFLSALEQRIEVETKKLEQAQQFKKALLQQMFV